MVICERWCVFSSCLMDTCRSSLMTARMVLIFTSIICEWGWQVGFAHTGTALKSFTNIEYHFNTVDLDKHLSSYYASFNSESVSITILLQRTQYFIAVRCSATMSTGFTKKTERSANSEIEHQLQYAIKCTLYNVDCCSMARTTCTYLWYQLAWCTTRRQVIIPI